LVPKADDLLPLPDVQGLTRWWQKRRNQFVQGQRYIAGQPLSPQALHHALATGPMRRRHVLAFELAGRTRGLCDVQTRAFYADQKQHLLLIQQQLTQQRVEFVMSHPAG
jgi:hypothetical protein